MSRKEALLIAESLAEAVEKGLLTREQAQKRFKYMMHERKMRDKMKKMQEKNPEVWNAMGTLLNK